MADNKNQSDLFSSREVAEIKRVAGGGEISMSKTSSHSLPLNYPDCSIYSNNIDTSSTSQSQLFNVSCKRLHVKINGIAVYAYLNLYIEWSSGGKTLETYFNLPISFSSEKDSFTLYPSENVLLSLPTTYNISKIVATINYFTLS